MRKLLIGAVNRWQQMVLARRSQIEAQRSDRRGTIADRLGRGGGSIWQSRSNPFVSCLQPRLIIPLFILSACALGGKPITMDAFYEIDLCTTSSQVVASLGKPYAMHEMADGYVEYEYIERIKIGARDAEERRYFILIKDGVVVSKRIKQSSPLPYTFDSYDMQTTQKSDDAPPQ